MAGTGPTDLHALAVELLTASAAALDTIPVYEASLGGAPLRQVIAPGTVVLDCCDQLAVNVGTINEGASELGGNINNITLIVTISRCVPVPDSSGNPPSVEDQTASSAQINADKWALWNYL